METKEEKKQEALGKVKKHNLVKKSVFLSEDLLELVRPMRIIFPHEIAGMWPIDPSLFCKMLEKKQLLSLKTKSKKHQKQIRQVNRRYEAFIVAKEAMDPSLVKDFENKYSLKKRIPGIPINGIPIPFQKVKKVFPDINTKKFTVIITQKLNK
ncbi:MAG: hypothetical protein ACTTKO_09730 [Candidatus Limimorpha sp.]